MCQLNLRRVLLRQQHLRVRSVKDIVVSRDLLQEGLKAIPVVVDVKFVRMTPDVENLRLIGLHGEELVRQLLHARPFLMVVHRGPEAVQILKLKADTPTA